MPLAEHGLLAQALSGVYDVEIIGTSRKGGIWAPMSDSEIPVKRICVESVPKVFLGLKKIF